MADDGFEDEGFDDWAEVYERQVARGDLTPRYCELLGLESGDRVLELGCGPGYTTYQLSDYVAPGDVYALDRHRGALVHLRKLQDRSLERIHLIVGDVSSLPCHFSKPTFTLAAFLLHHVKTPRRVIGSIASALPEGSPFLLVEYQAEAPGEFGPSIERRIPRAQATTWLAEAGFTLAEETDLPEEKYGLLARR